MSATRRRRRGSGSIGSLKARLWAAIEYAVVTLEDERLPHDLRLKATNSLTQAAGAWLKVEEARVLADHEDRLRAIEHLLHGQYEVTKNGQH